VADASNILNQLQVGQIRSTGVEFQAVATLIDGLDLVGAYTVFDLRNSKVTDQATLGLVPTNLPTETASLFLDYTHQTGPFKGLGIGGGVRFVGSSYADPLNTYRVPDYTLFDGAVHYDRDGWRLAVNAQNLFDRTFVASCSTPNACFYGDRRKVTASLSYRW
jgi:iron complex outermembrane receptor protein